MSKDSRDARKTSGLALVERLASDLAPVRVAGPSDVFARLGLLAATALVGTGVVFIYGLRPDLGQVRGHFYFYGAAALALATAALGWRTALVSAVPGRRESRAARVSLFALLLAQAAVIGLSSPSHALAEGAAASGFACSLTLLVLTIAPLAAAFWLLRRLAPVHPRRTAVFALCAVTSVGLLALSLHCPSKNGVHGLLYHWGAALFVIAAVSGLLARRLRW